MGPTSRVSVGWRKLVRLESVGRGGRGRARVRSQIQRREVRGEVAHDPRHLLEHQLDQRGAPRVSAGSRQRSPDVQQQQLVPQVEDVRPQRRVGMLDAGRRACVSRRRTTRKRGERQRTDLEGAFGLGVQQLEELPEVGVPGVTEALSLVGDRAQQRTAVGRVRDRLEQAAGGCRPPCPAVRGVRADEGVIREVLRPEMPLPG